MKITQISTVVEYRDTMDGPEPILDATVYGLGEDNRMYYWGVTETKETVLPEPNEDGETVTYEDVYGWVPSRS